MATTAALITSPGRAALSVISVQGPAAASIVGSHCHGKSAPPAQLDVHGRLFAGKWRSALGEPVVVHARSANRVDICCHGGMMPVRRILADLAAAGVPIVSANDAVRQTVDTMIEAEASDCLADAVTLRCADILLNQLGGSLADAVRQIQSLVRCRNSRDAADRARRLLDRSQLGMRLVQPWRVAIVGRPNVGKSSLLNAIVGFDRAIVHETSGTTRDRLTAGTAIDGWPVELCDTAGFHETSDEIELAGIARARRAIDDSDWQIVVFDRGQPFIPLDRAILESCPRAIPVVNKSDIEPRWNAAEQLPGCVLISTLTGDGIGRLISELGGTLVPDPPATGDPVPFTVRQIELLRRTESSLAQSDTLPAIQSLDELIGAKA